MRSCYITRREHFNAAHRLYVETWSDEENMRVFGRCANKNGHGHNFTLFVTVAGNPDPQTGFVVNLKELSQLIQVHITDRVDHKNLNVDVNFMQGIIPSIENMAMAFWKELAPHIRGGRLHCIKLVETENNFVEYYGD